MKPSGDAPAPTAEAKKQRRDVFDLIDAAYNAGRQCYRADVKPNSDAAIAAAVGCSEALVASVRDEFFGPPGIVEPPDLKKLECSIAELQKSAQEMEHIAQSLKQKAKDLRSDAVGLQTRLDELCREYGWNCDG